MVILIEINKAKATVVPVTNGISQVWERYHRKITIGEGQFGKVVVCQKTNEPDRGKHYALKVLKKSMLVAAHQTRHAIHEKRLLCTLSQSDKTHPFIVTLKDHDCYMVSNLVLVVYYRGYAAALYVYWPGSFKTQKLKNFQNR